MSNTRFQALLTALSITPRDSNLLQNAFVHRSYLNEGTDFSSNNERLEYLGDAVLELATSDFLYRSYPEYQEGMLTNIRAALVRTESLADVALNLGFADLILMSKGETATGGKSNKSILADCFEAFLGALYLDQGFDAVAKLLSLHLFPRAKTVITEGAYKDNKSFLQEIAQAEFKATPLYTLISESGPDHDKEFIMEVSIGGKPFARGTGKSKQASQEDAAKHTIELLHKN